MRHPATLQVNVDHGHFVNVVELRRGVAHDIELTTIAVNQRRARIELAVAADSRRESLTSVELTNLPTNLGRKPRIVLETAVTGRGSLELSFVVEGRRVTTRTVSVRRWLPTRHALWLAPLAVLVAALLVWLGLRLFAPNDSPMAVPVPEGPAATEDATAVADQGAGRAVDGAAGPAADRAEEEPPAPDVEAVSREWTVYFRPDDPTLTETTMTRLGDIIDTIRDLTGDERGIAELRLVGHCALAGTEAGRVELSQARAGNVWRFLRQNGFGQPDELTVTGVGGQQPVTRDEEQQHLNRRVEISVQLEPRS